jgi:hypothetical protein
MVDKDENQRRSKASSFLRSNVSRLIKAAKKNGIPISRVEISPDKIVIFSGDPVPETNTSPLENWRAQRGSR